MPDKKDSLKVKGCGFEANAQGVGGFVTLLLLVAMGIGALAFGWL